MQYYHGQGELQTSQRRPSAGVTTRQSGTQRHCLRVEQTRYLAPQCQLCLGASRLHSRPLPASTWASPPTCLAWERQVVASSFWAATSSTATNNYVFPRSSCKPSHWSREPSTSLWRVCLKKKGSSDQHRGALRQPCCLWFSVWSLCRVDPPVNPTTHSCVIWWQITLRERIFPE